MSLNFNDAENLSIRFTFLNLFSCELTKSSVIEILLPSALISIFPVIP